MKKKMQLMLILSACAMSAHSWNAGINTFTPEHKFHVIKFLRRILPLQFEVSVLKIHQQTLMYIRCTIQMNLKRPPLIIRQVQILWRMCKAVLGGYEPDIWMQNLPKRVQHQYLQIVLPSDCNCWSIRIWLLKISIRQLLEQD